MVAIAGIACIRDVDHNALPSQHICLPAECTKVGIMANVYAELGERLTKFILVQPIFSVSAPCLAASGGGGHLNVSPGTQRHLHGPRPRAAAGRISPAGPCLADRGNRRPATS